MITAWPPPRMLRARASTGPWRRVLAMAVLLFGVVFTHGLHDDSLKGHLVTSAAVAAHGSPEEAPEATEGQALSLPPALDEPHEGHGPSHPSEHCVSGQPPQGPVVTPPCCAGSVGASADVRYASVKRGLSEPALSAAPSASLRLSVVQQV